MLADAATDVEIRFQARGDDASRLEIVHRGWERLGATGAAGRAQNRHGWATVLPHFRAATTNGASR